MAETESSSNAATSVGVEQSLFDQLKAKVDGIASQATSGSSSPSVIDSRAAEYYLAHALSEEYLEQYSENNGAVTSFDPYAQMQVQSLAFSNASLGSYRSFGVQPWDTSDFKLWISDENRDTATYESMQSGNGSIGLFMIGGEVRNLPDVAECQGEYSDNVKLAAGLFVDMFWTSNSLRHATIPPENPCQYVSTSEPLKTDTRAMWDPQSTIVTSNVRGYTFAYDKIPNYQTSKVGWPYSMSGVPVLPTLFIRDLGLPAEDYVGNDRYSYTLAVWFRKECYTYLGKECQAVDSKMEDVKATIQKLSDDLTTRTVLIKHCGYGECY